jgi:hypothetical protein
MAVEDFKKVREKLNRVVKEAIDTAKNSAATEVVCLNIDFFKEPK